MWVRVSGGVIRSVWVIQCGCSQGQCGCSQVSVSVGVIRSVWVRVSVGVGRCGNGLSFSGVQLNHILINNSMFQLSLSATNHRGVSLPLLLLFLKCENDSFVK